MSSASSLAKTNHNLRAKQMSMKRMFIGGLVETTTAGIVGALEGHGKLPINYGPVPVKPVAGAVFCIFGYLAGGAFGRGLFDAGKTLGICYVYDASKTKSFIAGGHSE